MGGWGREKKAVLIINPKHYVSTTKLANSKQIIPGKVMDTRKLSLSYSV
jgi:hypothetical protein